MDATGPCESTPTRGQCPGSASPDCDESWLASSFLRAENAFFRFAGKLAASGLLAVVVAAGAPTPAASENPPGITTLVSRATHACFSDRVRVAGFLVPEAVAIATVDSEGYKVTDILVNEGDVVTAGQTLARITRQIPGRPVAAAIVRAPAGGLVIGLATMVCTMASPQADPMFRIAIDGKIDLEVEVPSMHLPKLKPGATARVSVDGGPELNGRVRTVATEIDNRGQMGKVRLSLDNNPSLRIGMFAHANIDASRSCGTSIPCSAVIRRGNNTMVQVIRDGKIETRNVRAGLVADNTVEILEGVKEGDVVVANAGTSLRDGDTIKMIFAEDSERARAR